jgi:hypothetical protein
VLVTIFTTLIGTEFVRIGGFTDGVMAFFAGGAFVVVAAGAGGGGAVRTGSLIGWDGWDGWDVVTTFVGTGFAFASADSLSRLKITIPTAARTAKFTIQSRKRIALRPFAGRSREFEGTGMRGVGGTGGAVAPRGLDGEGACGCGLAGCGAGGVDAGAAGSRTALLHFEQMLVPPAE